MATLIRPKHTTIYGQSSNFWQGGPVWFVAHIVYVGGAVSMVKQASKEGSSSPATSHPDQKYWGNITSLNLTNVARIEFDCTLMPCHEHGNNSCLFVLPRMIANDYGGNNVPLRFYSHRYEGVGNSTSDNKRYFNCHSGMNINALKQAYNGHQPWAWAPMPAGNNAPTYDQF